MYWLKKALAMPKILPSYHLVWLLFAVIAGVIIHQTLPFVLASKWVFWFLLASVSVIACISSSRFPDVIRLMWLFLSFALIGIAAASAELSLSSHRSEFKETHRGSFSIQIETIEQVGSNKKRITGQIVDSPLTDDVFLALKRVRIIADKVTEQAKAGDILNLDGRLFPLSPPVFPNAPDYAQSLWMKDIHATGISWQVNFAEHLDTPVFRAQLERYRHHLADRIRAVLPSPEAEIAATMLVGVRDGLPEEVYRDFRKAGLSHLLAISGLHMGIFCFLVLLVARRLFALVPSLSIYIPAHKIAAITAFLVGICYLLITGVPISALRAFVMASLVVLAIVTDRSAFTQRNLALVGLGIVLISPSVIFTASFQLSFIATFALIFVVQLTQGRIGNLPIIRNILFLSLSSTLIILFSLISVAWHFGSVSLWGVLSNIIAIPFTASIVMPAGVVVLLATLFDSAAWFAAPQSFALSLLLKCAMFFAALDFSEIKLYPPPYAMLYFWPFASLASISIRGSLQIVGMISIPLMGLIWMALMLAIATLHFQSGNYVLTWKTQQGIYTSQDISGFWSRQVSRYLGQTPDVNMSCEQGVCRFISDTQKIGFVAKRYALTSACKQNLDLLVTVHQPYFSCPAPQNILVVATQRPFGILIVETAKGYQLITDQHNLRWRPWRAHLFQE